MLFKDLSLGTSFFGVLPIVLPFRKALVSTVQMAPRYGPQIQWFLHSGYQNLAKKNFCNFFVNVNFFFERGIMSPKTNVLGPWRETYGNDPGTVKFLQKCIFFRKQPPTFFLFLTCRFKNLNFLLSKSCWILKFLRK